MYFNTADCLTMNVNEAVEKFYGMHLNANEI